MAIAVKDPKGAYALLEGLDAPTVLADIRVPAKRLLDALRPLVTPRSVPVPAPVKVTPPPLTQPVTTNLSPQERSLVMAKDAAAAYERSARAVDQALGLATAFTRARKRPEAEKALADAHEQVAVVEKTHPSVAALLRERLERVERLLATVVAGAPARETQWSDATEGGAEAKKTAITLATSARRAALAKDPRAFYIALEKLERESLTLPPDDQEMVQATVKTLLLRMRKGGS
jgi:hypothetical protein